MWGNKRAAISLPPLATQNGGALPLVDKLVNLTGAVAKRAVAHADHRQVRQSPRRVVPNPISGHVQLTATSSAVSKGSDTCIHSGICSSAISTLLWSSMRRPIRRYGMLVCLRSPSNSHPDVLWCPLRVNGSERKYLVIAAAMTAFDLFVAFRYGVAVWQAYADVLPAQLLLVLFVTVWLTSLADLWSRAIHVAKEAPRARRIRLLDIPPSTAANAEASDV